MVAASAVTELYDVRLLQNERVIMALPIYNVSFDSCRISCFLVLLCIIDYLNVSVEYRSICLSRFFIRTMVLFFKGSLRTEYNRSFR